VLLPLYPQFSTATTASSLDAWQSAAAAAGLRATTTTICCYPENDGFVAALAAMTHEALADLAASGAVPRVLFSAHGLPERVIKAGDPYQWQVERTAAAITSRLARPGLETVVCYQSRVGPLTWIGPSTEEEIRRCGSDGRAAIVVPLAFVSEHSETLVELDLEYRDLAAASGVPVWRRVATAGTHPEFIAGLAATVRRAILWSDARLAPAGGVRICPIGMRGCPCREVA
jgi:ferrochelatase